MAVPRIVHYCWFGEKTMPVREQECILTWAENLKDCEIIQWSEKNFDCNQCLFVKQAYESKNYAFVSDYVRAKVLYEFGGLYLDTDVKVLKPLTPYFNGTGFLGFERKAFIGTAILACEKHDPCIGQLLDYYEKHSFLQEGGAFDTIANVSILTDILKAQGLVLGGKRQTVQAFEVYNREVFYPKKVTDEQFEITYETATVHMCSNSWLSEREKKRGKNKFWIGVLRPILRRCRSFGIVLIGKERIRNIEIKVRNKLR